MIVLPLRFRIIVLVSVVLILWTAYLMNKDSKPITDYDNINGQITYINETYEDLPKRNIGKYRYILIDNYPSVLELFIGKETGDFKPKYENIDNLKIGDSITVYGENINKNLYIDRTILYIKKGNDLYYEKGNSKKALGIAMISISVLFSVFGFILLKKKKINY